MPVKSPQADLGRAGWLKMMHGMVCFGVWTFRSCVGFYGVVTAASAGQRILGEERKQDLGEINTPPVIIPGVARPAVESVQRQRSGAPHRPPPREASRLCTVRGRTCRLNDHSQQHKHCRHQWRKHHKAKGLYLFL